jgi:hypothetical protein
MHGQEDTRIITCPSGLSGTIRGLTVREERILADQRLAKAGHQVEALLTACWTETSDCGPYEFASDKPQWGKVLQGDAFYCLLQVRALTYGDEYDFSVRCRNSSCRQAIDWSLQLSELPMRLLSEDSRDGFTHGNRLPTTLPSCGKKAWFKLATGDDERKLAAGRSRQNGGMLASVLALRVAEVEGVKAPDMPAFLESLALRDANFLMSQFERVDCGVETSIEIECPHCFEVQQVDLPLDPSFLWPQTRPSTASLQSSRRSA